METDALSTLAFDYPRRAAFFRGELEEYLLLVRETGLDPLGTEGSYAGAIGVPASSRVASVVRMSGRSRSPRRTCPSGLSGT